MRFQKDESQKRERRAQIAREKRERIAEAALERASKKRAVPDYSSTGNDVPHIDGSSPTGSHATPPPSKKAKKCLEPPRRPEATDAYYSHMAQEQSWTGRSQASELKLSHIGRIQETGAGEVAPYKCGNCKYSKEPCRVYKETSVGKYFYARGTNKWRACGRCRFREWECDHVRDAIRNSPTEKEVQFEEEVAVMSEYMSNGAHYPGEAFIKAEVARLRQERAASSAVAR